MLTKKFNDCPEIIAGDNCILRELLNPANDSANVRYSLAWAKVPVNTKTWIHAMKTTEVYYILNGEGIMHINEESSPAVVGDTIYIPAGAQQYIENTGKNELLFLCIVDPAWKKEDEVLIEK